MSEQNTLEIQCMNIDVDNFYFDRKKLFEQIKTKFESVFDNKITVSNRSEINIVKGNNSKNELNILFEDKENIGKEELINILKKNNFDAKELITSDIIMASLKTNANDTDYNCLLPEKDNPKIFKLICNFDLEFVFSNEN